MNQLRRFTRISLIHKIRQANLQLHIGLLGKKVFVERNVRILRFRKNVEIFSHVIIKEGTRICACNEKATIRIGENTTVGYHTFIFSSEKIEIGADCMIAPFVYIVDSDHGTDRAKKMNQQPNQTAPINIGNDVWIGTGAKILKGVTIGNGAVIAAGALVKDNVEPYSIVGGIPARKISERK